VNCCINKIIKEESGLENNMKTALSWAKG